MVDPGAWLRQGRCRAWMVAAILAVGALLPRGAAGQERPAYRVERYDEDWSLLRDPALRRDPWDGWKYRPLGHDGWFVDVGWRSARAVRTAGSSRLRQWIDGSRWVLPATVSVLGRRSPGAQDPRVCRAAEWTLERPRRRTAAHRSRSGRRKSSVSGCRGGTRRRGARRTAGGGIWQRPPDLSGRSLERAAIVRRCPAHRATPTCRVQRAGSAPG